MSDIVLVAIISGICSLAGTFFGIVKSSNMTNYRLEMLEQKVNKHNNLVERMALAERDIEVIQEEIHHDHH